MFHNATQSLRRLNNDCRSIDDLISQVIFDFDRFTVLQLIKTVINKLKLFFSLYAICYFDTLDTSRYF